jgi:hypothetical protein
LKEHNLIGRAVLACLAMMPLALTAGVEFAFGPAAGVTLPLDGSIRRSDPSWHAGIDFRVTGFQPIVGLGLSAAYTRLQGPYRDSLRRDSSAYSYRYLPAAAYLFTDFSRIAGNSPVRPCFRLGFGPCLWDLRRGGDLLPTPGDSSQLSREFDYAFIAGIGLERRLGRMPIAIAFDLTGWYVTSTHFEKYTAFDRDESFATAALAIRYLMP